MAQDLIPEQPLYFKIKNTKNHKINNLQVWIVNGNSATMLKNNI